MEGSRWREAGGYHSPMDAEEPEEAEELEEGQVLPTDQVSAPAWDPAIELPVGPGEPWRIPGTGALQEGHGAALLLERPEGPVIEVILCRVDGSLQALDSTCPHEGGRIQGGELIEGRYARCPLHWFDFDPKNGECVNVDCDPADTLRVEERDGVGLVW
ncbi:MAG: nitrite reductase/ring-hydroxylating ferredoxin subunit, partial [Gammaproteobacteria bacterium]